METPENAFSPVVATLNTLAAATLWGTILGPVLYPIGASLGLWHELLRVASSCGDDPVDFTVAKLGAAAGAIVGLVLVAGQWRYGRGRAFGAVAADLMRFYLALVLFGYGLSKVTATQFPHLWANLDTPPSELTPMRVAWQFFGYSRGYQQFLGWGEIVPALLLLPRRTASLGALLAVVVMANVFAINLFFDVCVKLGSGLYLAYSLFILLQETGRLWHFFIGQRPLRPRRVATDWFLTRRGRRIYRSLTGALVALAVVGGVLSVQEARSYGRTQRDTPLAGIWQPRRVERWQAGQWQLVPPADSAFPAKVYLQAGQVVLRNSFRRDRFIAAKEDSVQHTLLLRPLNLHNDRNLPLLHWRFAHLQPGDSIQLSGRWRRDSLRLVATRGQLNGVR